MTNVFTFWPTLVLTNLQLHICVFSDGILHGCNTIMQIDGQTYIYTQQNCQNCFYDGSRSKKCLQECILRHTHTHTHAHNPLRESAITTRSRLLKYIFSLILDSTKYQCNSHQRWTMNKLGRIWWKNNLQPAAPKLLFSHDISCQLINPHGPAFNKLFTCMLTIKLDQGLD